MDSSNHSIVRLPSRVLCEGEGEQNRARQRSAVLSTAPPPQRLEEKVQFVQVMPNVNKIRQSANFLGLEQCFALPYNGPAPTFNEELNSTRSCVNSLGSSPCIACGIFGNDL
jgi:hypothetical protein